MNSSDNSPQQRINRGRRRVPIERMENQTNLQVTFSKRRAGLFKKTSELCALTGAEAAVVVFSPSDKVYSFGHPDVYSIANRFNHQNPPPYQYPPNHPLLQVPEGSNVELNRIESMIEMEKRRGLELRQEVRNSGTPQNEELDYQQLEERRDAIQAFRNGVDTYIQNRSSTNVVYDPMASYGGVPGVPHGFKGGFGPFGGGSGGGFH